jgi:hypothetical protein
MEGEEDIEDKLEVGPQAHLHYFQYGKTCHITKDCLVAAHLVKLCQKNNKSKNMSQGNYLELEEDIAQYKDA